MTGASGTPAAGASPGKAAPPAADLTSVLRSRGYHALMLAAAVLGLPIAVIAFGFLAAVTSMEKWVWQTVPTHFGWDQPKAWYAVLVLTLAGALVGLVVARLPGRGGHVAANGFGGGMTQPVDLTGVLLAATLSLVLGAVIGPEAPLIALGRGPGDSGGQPDPAARVAAGGCRCSPPPALPRPSRRSSATLWSLACSCSRWWVLPGARSCWCCWPVWCPAGSAR